MVIDKMNKELKSYFKSIRQGLTCSLNAKRAFTSMLKDRINDFLAENPEASFEDIVSNFGTPEEIISEFNSDKYSTELKRKKTQILILEIVAVILVVLTVILTVALREAQDQGYTEINTDDYIESDVE